MFETQTDTEVVAHLLDRELAAGRSPVDAVKATLGKAGGRLRAGDPVRRRGRPSDRRPPGQSAGDWSWRGQMYLGSDAIALAPFTDAITYLEDGDWAA